MGDRGPLLGAEHLGEQVQHRDEDGGGEPRGDADQDDQQQEPTAGAHQRVAADGGDAPDHPLPHRGGTYSAVHARVAARGTPMMPGKRWTIVHRNLRRLVLGIIGVLVAGERGHHGRILGQPAA